MATDCAKCGGTGKIRYGTIGDALPIDLGNGTTIQAMGGFGTRACECVRDLPAIDGDACWWETEDIYSTHITEGVVMGSECIYVSADCEVPRNDLGRRVHRTARNAYYPPMVRVEVDGGSVTMRVDGAEKLIEALTAAVQLCGNAEALAQQETC